MKSAIEPILTTAVAIAIVAMAVVVVRREFFSGSDDSGPPPAPTFVKNWETLRVSGTSEFGPGRQITIVEFADLQCPACRYYQGILEKVERRFRPRVNVVYVHFPLSYHKMAHAAARAAECADAQGKFGPFVSNVYKRQDSLTKRPLEAYATDVGLNIPNFARCIADSAVSARRVQIGMAAADTFEVKATPTVIVEGWRFEFGPAEKYLSQFIKDLENGRVKAPTK